MTLSYKPGIKRTYLAVAGAMALGAAGAAALPLQFAKAAAPFESIPVEAGRAIALAQPLSGNRWNLVVLEQLEPAPPCWRRFEDGSVTTYEKNLPAGSCGLYSSSSAYSLRLADNDLSHPWRLRVESRGDRLELLATSPEQPTPLLVGSAESAGNGLVELQLAQGWGFGRRSFGGQSLNHLYVSHAEPLPVLLARANAGGGELLGLATPPPPPSPVQTATALAASPSQDTRSQPASSRLARLESLRLGGSRDRSWEQQPSSESEAGGVVALQVVPYRP
ncbi:MAG: DUF3747 domain-containing protein [Cyanobium sp. PLM2.Bin73]|jgi:hypothetical protein|nr:MAG: DUF3747 domain-containing protein [Cyanobium sp. PLM2.Bin73]